MPISGLKPSFYWVFDKKMSVVLRYLTVVSLNFATVSRIFIAVWQYQCAVSRYCGAGLRYRMIAPRNAAMVSGNFGRVFGSLIRSPFNLTAVLKSHTDATSSFLDVYEDVERG